MGELFELFERWAGKELVEGAVKGFAYLSRELAPKVLLLVSAAMSMIEHSLEGVGESMLRLAQSLAARAVSKYVSEEPDVAAATIQLNQELGQALVADYKFVLAAIVICVVSPLAFAGLPLAYKFLTRRRQLVFVSFNRAREVVAREVQAALDHAGERVYRVPFDETATHQSVVTRVPLGIKACDGVVCIPGPAASYVEHEVLAATTADKPIVFVVSEAAGTLPNTADKRYPVFKLETTKKAQFEPLIKFIEYIGADLKSTWKLCGAAVAHPFMSMSGSVALTFFGCTLLALWAWVFLEITGAGAAIAKTIPRGWVVETPVVMAQLLVLGTAVAVMVIVGSFSVLFVVNLFRQLRARSKARLKTTAARFDRADWLGVVPGISRDALLYECLFESAPAAHHEIRQPAGLPAG